MVGTECWAALRKQQTLAAQLERERTKGLSGVIGPGRDGAKGQVGNQAESPVLGVRMGENEGTC